MKSNFLGRSRGFLRKLGTRSIFSAVAVAAAVLLVACGDSTEEKQAQNASELRAELENLPYDVHFREPPQRTGFPEGPGVLYGTLTTPEGQDGHFWFSVGPSAEALPGRSMGRSAPAATEDFYAKIASSKKLHRWPEKAEFLNAIVAIEGAGCEVLTGEPCPV
jgi:hypothetical protein